MSTMSKVTQKAKISNKYQHKKTLLTKLFKTSIKINKLRKILSRKDSHINPRNRKINLFLPKKVLFLLSQR